MSRGMIADARLSPATDDQELILTDDVGVEALLSEVAQVKLSLGEELSEVLTSAVRGRGAIAQGRALIATVREPNNDARPRA